MEQILDVFGSDAFTLVSLTDSINRIPFIPGRLGEMGLFTEQGIPTTRIALEEQMGYIKLVSPSPRGGPGETRPKLNRTMRDLRAQHMQIDDPVLAEEVMNVREFGPQMQPRSVESYLQNRMSMITGQFDATLEAMRVGAVLGLITYADGSTLDLFDTFGISQDSAIAFPLSSDSTEVRKLATGVKRQMMRNLGGTMMSGVYALLGNDAWDAFIEHPEVRDTFRYQEGYKLREGVAYGSIQFGGITWENYMGWIGGSEGDTTSYTPLLGDSEIRFFPMGVPNMFKTYFAPADYIETVNTVGLPRYAKAIPSDNNKSVRLEVQTNPLSICTRPKALLRGTLS